MKRALIVGGSIGAVVLLVLMSFNSVVASNVHQQITTEKGILIHEHLQKLVSSHPQFDIFKLLDLLGVIFDIIISLILRFSFNHPPSS